VDWASEKHDVVIQDATGEEVLAATYVHDERGLSALCSTLVRLNVVLVAIERPDGLLVERLLDAGLRVMAIHPNQVHAARARFRTSGGSPIASTRSCSACSPAPTITASESWSPTATTPRRCAP
jgi:hypothetical protein